MKDETRKLKNIIKWVDALESGKYKQGRSQLGSTDIGYCCLGVGCKVLKIEFNEFDSNSLAFSEAVGLDHQEGSLLRKPFWAQHSLTEINDHSKAGFKRIAKLLKTRPEDLFEPKVAKLVKKYYKT